MENKKEYCIQIVLYAFCIILNKKPRIKNFFMISTKGGCRSHVFMQGFFKTVPSEKEPLRKHKLSLANLSYSYSKFLK